MKKTIVTLLIISICSGLFAAEKKAKIDESVEAYRRAIEAMDAQDFGKTLK